MRLQRLEIKGFKSFAHETVINFDQPVIGVVGPNGAGKSNLVDAVRWVLGEQKSKDLRLERMSDVIFNGTKKRKKGGVARVTLIFENTKNLLPTEYQTVSISRYLYQTGESEYRLNNVVCRLKDIRSLFLDTGIGSNSYAIIALGMVEDILADKENARRRMFEQAAGISKYKARKRETLNKLNNTQADLDRVEDLLFEIEQNLKILEKQARRTQRYFNLKEKYRDESVKLAVLKINDLKQSYQDLSARIETESDAYRQLGVSIREAEASLEALKQKHLDKEKSLSDFQRSMNELIGNIRGAENDKKMLRQKQGFREQGIQTLEDKIDRNHQKLEELTQKLADTQLALEKEQALEQQLLTQLEAAKQDLAAVEQGHGDSKQVLATIMAGHQARQQELVELEKKMVVNQATAQSTQSELEKLHGEVRERNTEYSQVEENLTQLRGRINTQEALVNVMEEEQFRRMQERAALEEEEDKIAKALSDINRQADARQHEYDLIKNLIDKLEGFPESIKFLNKNSAWSRKAPLLSDLIYCVDPYRVVIENYLEPYLNHYVADTIEDAATAIRLLSDAQKGRANFFILDAFKDGLKADAYEGLIPAVEVVEVDDKYRPVVHHLLHNVFISEAASEDFEHLRRDDLVILSADGQIIRGSRSISGGSVGLFEGKKLGRKKYLKKLESILAGLAEKVEKKQAEQDEINDKLANLDSVENAEDLEAEKKVTEELRREEVYLASRLEHFRDMDSGSSDSIKSLDARLITLEEEAKLLTAGIDTARQALEHEQTNMASADDSHQQIAAKLAEQNAAVNHQNIQLIRHQGQIESLDREMRYAQHQIKELSNQIEQDKAALGVAGDELVEIKANLESIDQQLREHYDVRKARESDLSGLEQSYYEARGEISAVEDKIRQTHKRQNDQQQLINDLKDSFTEVKFKMSNVGERLKIEFDILLDDVLQMDTPEAVDLAQLEEQVERMRHRINNYGEINPMAVDAFTEMNERYESITGQRDDILEARDSLLETIQEIEATATERFMEAFTDVRTYFIEVFRSLFTEDDTCDLILLEPESPLTSGIEIIAKPKGKRPKTLSQLSGGEKTLTAIALLFGLYLLKPAPFCIFDEVDAPLDDANIEKFNRIIKRFSKDSQFIIITHNKLTMAAVDIIYGVYMEEQGVSSVSAVDFRDFSHASLLEVTG